MINRIGPNVFPWNDDVTVKQQPTMALIARALSIVDCIEEHCVQMDGYRGWANYQIRSIIDTLGRQGQELAIAEFLMFLEMIVPPNDRAMWPLAGVVEQLKPGIAIEDE